MRAADARFAKGDVLLVRLDPVEGSEQGGTRPVLVISNDPFNRNLSVLTVAPITSRKMHRLFPAEVLIEAPEGGLTRAGKILLYHLRTIGKHRVTKKMGTISPSLLASVEEALRLALGLH